jgi:hypothetical protein
MMQSERESFMFLSMVIGLIPACYFPFDSMVKEFISLRCALLKAIIFCVLFNGNIGIFQNRIM